MTFQLVEGPGPALFVAAAGRLVLQARMGERQFSAISGRTKIDLDAGFAGVVAAFDPAPGHRQPLRSYDLQILAGAFMVAAVEHAETDPKAATDPDIGLGQQDRAGVGT